MLALNLGCEFEWEAEVPTASVVQVEPRPDLEYVVDRTAWTITPEVPSTVYVDSYGNRCRRLTLPPGPCKLVFDTNLRTSSVPDDADETAAEVPPVDLPDDVLAFTLPSRFCQSDLLGDEAWARFGQIEPGYARVRAISEWVHHHLTWRAGTSLASTSALDVFHAGEGVCRDFAHLAISFCRALSIPARYVFGYLPDIDVRAAEEPMDFCAWMEVFLGGRWYTFDPRNNARRAGRVVIGRGRDALDVAMFTTFGGPTLHTMSVWADVA